MKKICNTFLILLILTSCNKEDDTNFIEKIYDGNVIVETQEQVENFASQNYSEINGNLMIGGVNRESVEITSLSPLKI